MNTEFKALSCMLCYPCAQIKDGVDEIAESIRINSDLSQRNKEALGKFLNEYKKTSLADLQKEYVGTFDIGRKASLNLFEHMHGDSRERGAALVSLKKLYEERGLQVESSEFADYLPMFLEFLSGIRRDEALVYLVAAAPYIARIHNELQKSASRWEPVVEAALEISQKGGQGGEIILAEKERRTLKERDDLMPETEAESFDRPVTFGAQADPTLASVHFSGFENLRKKNTEEV